MWQEGYSKLLYDEINSLLELLSDKTGLTDLVLEALSTLRHDLVTTTIRSRAWYLLAPNICNAICGHCEQVVPASAGLELLKTSAEVFDDIEDADSPASLSSKYGTPLAINTASALLILAERAFGRLINRGVDCQTVVNIIDAVNAYYTTVAAGQHLDLSLTPEELGGEDAYLRLIEMKSGTAVACACYLGAVLAKADTELVDVFILFGHNLGMASQIANDIKGITSLTDIEKRKITLPVIYALAQTDGETHQLLTSVFHKPNLENNPAPEKVKEILFRTGAIQYAMVKMEYYKQRASDTLVLAERKKINVEQIRDFLM